MTRAAPTPESSRIAERDGWHWFVGRTKIADLEKNFETEDTDSGSSEGGLRSPPETFDVFASAETGTTTVRTPLSSKEIM